MDRLPTLCRRTLILQNLKIITSLNHANSNPAPLVTHARCMGGHGTPSNWKSLKQVAIDNKSHMDFMPVPKGSWQEYYDKSNKKFNMQVLSGLLACGAIYSYLYAKGHLTPFLSYKAKDFKYYDERFNDPDPNKPGESGAGIAALAVASVVASSDEENGAATEEVAQEAPAEEAAPEAPAEEVASDAPADVAAENVNNNATEEATPAEAVVAEEVVQVAEVAPEVPAEEVAPEAPAEVAPEAPAEVAPEAPAEEVPAIVEDVNNNATKEETPAEVVVAEEVVEVAEVAPETPAEVAPEAPAEEVPVVEDVNNNATKEETPAEVVVAEEVVKEAPAEEVAPEAPAEEAKPVVELPEVPAHAQYLLVGAGTATFGAFRAIKSRDPKAKILIVGEEPTTPYMRPPLSKELWFNDNKEEVESLQFKQWNGKKRSIFYEPKEFFADPKLLNTMEDGGIALLSGKKVVKIDAAKKTVWLASGESISYDKCLVATGGKPRNLPTLKDSDIEVQKRTLLFRNAEDFKSLDKITETAESVAIVGGGFLGSELACALGKRGASNGMKVYQIYPEKGNMGKVLPEYLSKWTTQKVEKEGVTVMPNSRVSKATFEEGKVIVHTEEGQSVKVDAIVAAVGLEPNTQLATASNLETDPLNGGFLVNAELEARRDLWVAGDAACFYDIKLGRRRVEHHDHAVVSGRLAGENMTGAAKPYWHQSMFWSDLGPEVGYEAIGICDASLPTVAVFAKASEQDTPKAVVEETGESLRSETENIAAEAPAAAEVSPPVLASPPSSSEDYGKGVVFYVRDKVVVGMLLWNIFNRMSIARQVLKDGAKNEDLYEVAKLFDIYDTMAEEESASS